MDVKKIEKQLKKLGVILVYLFGSQAKGKATPLSDFDFAVLMKDSAFPQEDLTLHLQLINLFTDICKNDRVDVVFFNEKKLPLAFKYRIIQEGLLIYNVDDTKRRDLEYSLMRAYSDQKYYIDQDVERSLQRLSKQKI